MKSETYLESIQDHLDDQNDRPNARYQVSS